MSSRPEAAPGPAAAAAGSPARPAPEWRALPNLISIARGLLAPVFVWAATAGHAGTALAVFVVAGVSDVLDGLAARLLRRKTRMGVWLDPAADKLLLTAAYVTMTLPAAASPNALPPLLTGVVVGRDLLIVAGALVIVLLRGRTQFPPTALGKTSTVLQVATLAAVVWLNARGTAAGAWIVWLYQLTALATVVSFLEYVRVGARKLKA